MYNIARGHVDSLEPQGRQGGGRELGTGLGTTSTQLHRADDDDQGYTLSIQAKHEGGTNYDQRKGDDDDAKG